MSWFVSINCLFVHGQFNYQFHNIDNFQDTWRLILQILEKCKAIEHVNLRADGWGMNLIPIPQPWPVLPKLKILDFHGLDRSWDTVVTLPPEVCVSLLS